MSDSELSTAAARPSDDQIEACLKRVTRIGMKEDAFTVNKARIAAEQELGLEAGFFKHDPTWKARSKEIVELAVDEPSPEKPKKPAPKPAPKAGRKRKSDEAPEQKKRPTKKARKQESEDDLDDEESEAQVTPSDEDDDFSEATPVKKPQAKRKAPKKRAKAVSDDDSEAEVETKKVPVKRKPVKKAAEKVVEDSEASDVDIKHDSPKPAAKTEDKKEVKATTEQAEDGSDLSDPPDEDKPDTNGKAAAPEDDESDMSVLIDEPPKRKRQKKTSPEPKTKSKTTAKATKSKKAANEGLSPGEEEIKRLQGWLVKCGIRKMWFKELAPYDTAKAKVKHLKGLLEEAGMTGRYSNEKAKDIKERRELAAELEATQEYAKKWGQDKDDDDNEGSGGEQVSEEELKPATRKPKGLVDFGDSGDDGSD
ncbi:hypothetical protein CB0940_10658 [Cercospora beticola]|uniref:Transcriptional regulator n=1 Tax=Cercospora beticola TaxID=122368 RepID=A0A2G5HTV5_CERBT|nr:hypothetical protein CB0940_10658 [Cercospora beticola]PIA95971.1 hypothetical protein CB0940_10658 [Cercospora beticola]WPB07385.1 hypothetical protein RHO25_012046 [Cercospora beticola]CAK1367366.1 unnamed protein product [Cercospora beticola]